MFDKYFHENSILEITLKGDVPEEISESILPFIGDERITVLEFIKISKYVVNTSVKALFLKIKNLNIGYARAYEIRSCISDIIKSGKEVFVYLEDPGNTEYFVSSSASKIFIPPWCTFNVIGLSIESYFIKGLLDKLKIEPEIEGFGEYKSAAEMFNRSSMSSSNREMLESLLSNQFNNMTDLISSDRNISKANIKKYIDSSPLKPEDAKAFKLVDEVAYENNVQEIIKEEFGPETKFLEYKNYRKISRLTETAKKLKLWFTGKRQYVGLININGLITQGTSRSGNGYVNTCGSDTIIGMINKAADDKNIRSVVIRVSSPGGSALASDLIRNRLEQLNIKKPVFISMSDVAASGGYMVSLSSEAIFANPFTITGSIGVVAGKFNFSGLLDYIGVSRDSLKKGKMAAMYSSNKKFSRDEKTKFLSLMEDMYQNFVKMVSSWRKLDPKDTEKASKGRVWNSSDALKLGLIDHIGTFRDCLNKAEESLDLDNENDKLIKVYKPQGKLTISGLNKLGFLNTELELTSFVKLLNRERIFTVIPNIFEIK